MSTKIMSRLPRVQTPAIRHRYAERFQELKREFDQVEYFMKGTVLQRRMKCGKPNCACRRDPAKRHGPYFEWTYKTKGKTVNVKLRPEEAPIYQAAARQHRRLKSVLSRLERLSRTALAQLARQARRRAGN